MNDPYVEVLRIARDGAARDAHHQGGQKMAAQLLFGEPGIGHILGEPVNVHVTLEWLEQEPPADILRAYCAHLGVVLGER